MKNVWTSWTSPAQSLAFWNLLPLYDRRLCLNEIIVFIASLQFDYQFFSYFGFSGKDRYCLVAYLSVKILRNKHNCFRTFQIAGRKFSRTANGILDLKLTRACFYAMFSSFLYVATSRHLRSALQSFRCDLCQVMHRC